MKDETTMAIKAFVHGLIAPQVVKHNAVAGAGLGTAMLMDIMDIEAVLKILVLFATLAYAVFHAARELAHFLRERRSDEDKQRRAEAREQRRKERFRKRFLPLAIGSFIALFLLSGCGQSVGTFRKAPALQGGTSEAKIGTNVTMRVAQPENPSQVAEQNYSRTEERSEVFPPGTDFVTSVTSTNGEVKVERVKIPAPMARTVKVTESTGAKIGAAQADTARGAWGDALATVEKYRAKLGSMKPVQFVGIVLIVAALAMFHPAVRAITMSTTLQAVTGMAGVAMIALPSVVVGNEKLILIAGIALPIAYFFIWKHGHLQGIVNMVKTEPTKANGPHPRLGDPPRV